MIISHIKRILAVVVPIALGAGAVAYMVSTKRGAPRKPVTETAYPMRVIAAPAFNLVPRASGYGLAEADRSWRAVARVAGRLIEVHPDMRSGGAINEGDMLLRIDPSDTEIAIAAAKASLHGLQADLDQIDVEFANNESALEIEKASLLVTNAELKRFEDLLLKDATSAAEVEDRRRSNLTQRQTVQSIDSAQALVPARRASLEAQLAGAQASLDQANRDRSYCEITAPFDAVLGQVSLEVGQYVSSQELLFELFDDVRSRIDAALPQDEVFRLLDAAARTRIAAAIQDPSRRRELVGDLFEARVSTQVGGFKRSWKGQVVGVRESLDAETRALRLTVVVEQSREALFSDAGPPLNRGTYCRIEVRAKPRSNVLAVPRSAIRDGSIFVLDSESRLARAELDLDFVQGELAVVRGGLEPGTPIVVAPPSPAILGMLVEAVPDDALLERMRADAAGETEKAQGNGQ